MSPDMLIERFRAYVGDTQEPYLWDEEDLYIAMDQAQKEFARRTDCFAQEFEVPVYAGEAYVQLPNTLTKVRSVRGRRSGPLTVTTVDKLDAEGVSSNDYGASHAFDWRSLEGDVSHFVLDAEHGKARLVGVPRQNDDLFISAYRLPCTDITGPDSVFEIKQPADIMALRFWMAFLMFEYNDVDGYDPEASARNLVRFEHHVSREAQAHRRRERKPGSIRYGGI